MQEHFSALLSENNLNLIQGKEPIHLLHFYYGRCLRIFKFQKEAEGKEDVFEKKDSKRKISEDLLIKPLNGIKSYNVTRDIFVTTRLS